jgi:hypothetical protein
MHRLQTRNFMRFLLPAHTATLLEKAGAAGSQGVAESYLGCAYSQALRELLDSNRKNAAEHMASKFRTINVKSGDHVALVISSFSFLHKAP